MKKALLILPSAVFLLAFSSNSDPAIQDTRMLEPEYQSDMLYYGTEAVQLPSDSPDADIPQDLLDQLGHYDDAQEKI